MTGHSYAVQGRDVYHLNAWSPRVSQAAGEQFVFLKATQGTGYTDPMFSLRLATATTAKLRVGAYHFGTGEDPIRQLDRFLSVAGAVKLKALDFEHNPLGATMSPDQARQFLTELKQRTGRALVYATAADCANHFGGFDHWVAQWGTNAPSIPWMFWQWQGTGYDADAWHGTLAQLDAYIGAGAPGKGDDLTKEESAQLADIHFWLRAEARAYGGRDSGQGWLDELAKKQAEARKQTTDMLAKLIAKTGA
jgi:hypothetical protein